MKMIKDLGFIKLNPNNLHIYHYAIFECPKCGNNFTTNLSRIKQKKTISCGCVRKLRFYKHGLSKTKIYLVWKHIRAKCYSIKCKEYKYYGGRGIKMSEEWRDDPLSFYNWAITHGYENNLEIDRINNDGDYIPNNCRWTTHKINSLNRRDNHKLTYHGETKTISEWSLLTGLSFMTIIYRLKKGYTSEQVLSNVKYKHFKNRM